MLVKTRYYLKFIPRDDENTNQYVEMYCSKWIAQRAFITLAYGIYRNGLYCKVALCERERATGRERVINSCDLDSFKFLKAHDGGKL